MLESLLNVWAHDVGLSHTSTAPPVSNWVIQGDHQDPANTIIHRTVKLRIDSTLIPPPVFPPSSSSASPRDPRSLLYAL